MPASQDQASLTELLYWTSNRMRCAFRLVSFCRTCTKLILEKKFRQLKDVMTSGSSECRLSPSLLLELACMDGALREGCVEASATGLVVGGFADPYRWQNWKKLRRGLSGKTHHNLTSSLTSTPAPRSSFELERPPLVSQTS
jgi:hypothetical protein